MRRKKTTFPLLTWEKGVEQGMRDKTNGVIRSHRSVDGVGTTAVSVRKRVTEISAGSLIPVVYSSQSPVGNATSFPARSRSAASVSHGSSAGFTRAKVGPVPATVEAPFPPTCAGSATPPPSLPLSLLMNTCVRMRHPNPAAMRQTV